MGKRQGMPGMQGMNRNQMMAQARKLQEQMLAAQEQAMKQEFTASTGGGAVKVTVSGGLRLLSLEIAPDAIDPEDVEMLQDMIVAAVNDALTTAEDATNQTMSQLTGGFGIPGLF